MSAFVCGICLSLVAPATFRNTHTGLCDDCDRRIQKETA